MMTTGHLETILRNWNIPAKEWGKFSALVFEGKRPNNSFLTRLRKESDYEGCLNEIMAELSKQVHFKFPPSNYIAT